MTWHHVAALMIAGALVGLAVFYHCESQVVGSVIGYAGLITAGVFGHAGKRENVLKIQHDKDKVERHAP